MAGSEKWAHCFEDSYWESLWEFLCLRYLAAKIIGYTIIAGSGLVKVPQIYKILSGSSAAGLSISCFAMELFGVSSTVAYSVGYEFPFSAWGEALFLDVQVTCIVFLILKFEFNDRRALLFLCAYAAAMTMLLSGLMPLWLLSAMQSLNLPVMFTGKMAQVAENHRNGHTGQLSAITVFLHFGGGLARIFTSYEETGDFLLIGMFALNSIANGLTAYQIVYYWYATPATVDNKKNGFVTPRTTRSSIALV